MNGERSTELSRRDFPTRTGLAGAAATAAAVGLAGCTARGDDGAQAGGGSTGGAQASDPPSSPGAGAVIENAQPTGRSNVEYAPDGKGFRYEQDHWRFVHIEGEPYERGFQHGYLLGPDIARCIETMQGYLLVTEGVEWDYLKAHATKQWLPALAEEWQEELRGIAEGAQARGGFPYTMEDVLTWNGREELADYWFPTVKKDYYAQLAGDTDATGGGAPKVDPDAKEHCSAFIATGSYTKDGQVVIAHNTWERLATAQFTNVVLDIVPAQGSHIIMQSAPGYLHGQTDFYETEHLVVVETTIGGFTVYDPSLKPEFARIREAVQYATTLDEFVDIMSYENNGGYANTWLAGDINTNEIMRVELGLKFINVERTTDGAYPGFNLPLDPRIRNLECSGAPFDDVRGPSARRVRIPQLLEEHKGVIDLQVAKEILSDHYDIYEERPDHPGCRTVCSHYWLDKMEVNTGRVPFMPHGATDGKVGSSATAKNFELVGRFGSSCGMGFDLGAWVTAHPQFDYLAPFMSDLPACAWTTLSAKL